MSFNSKLILSRYTQARQALTDYSLSMLKNLRSGNKSRAKIRKFNVMSMWIDYIGETLNTPEAVPLTSPSKITLSFISRDTSSTSRVVLSIETALGKNVPLCITDPLNEYTTLSALITSIVNKINNSSQLEGIQPHGITAARVGDTIRLTLDGGALYNNAVVVANPAHIVIYSTKALGGVSKVSSSVLHTEEIQSKILTLLDTLAIELDITYKTEKQSITDDLINRSREVERRDNRITLDRGDSISDENNKNLEL